MASLLIMQGTALYLLIATYSCLVTAGAAKTYECRMVNSSEERTCYTTGYSKTLVSFKPDSLSITVEKNEFLVWVEIIKIYYQQKSTNRQRYGYRYKLDFQTSEPPQNLGEIMFTFFSQTSTIQVHGTCALFWFDTSFDCLYDTVGKMFQKRRDEWRLRASQERISYRLSAAVQSDYASHDPRCKPQGESTCPEAVVEIRTVYVLPKYDERGISEVQERESPKHRPGQTKHGEAKAEGESKRMNKERTKPHKKKGKKQRGKPKWQKKKGPKKLPGRDSKNNLGKSEEPMEPKIIEEKVKPPSSTTLGDSGKAVEKPVQHTPSIVEESNVVGGVSSTLLPTEQPTEMLIPTSTLKTWTKTVPTDVPPQAPTQGVTEEVAPPVPAKILPPEKGKFPSQVEDKVPPVGKENVPLGVPEKNSPKGRANLPIPDVPAVSSPLPSQSLMKAQFSTRVLARNLETTTRHPRARDNNKEINLDDEIDTDFEVEMASPKIDEDYDYNDKGVTDAPTPAATRDSTLTSAKSKPTKSVTDLEVQMKGVHAGSSKPRMTFPMGCVILFISVTFAKLFDT